MFQNGGMFGKNGDIENQNQLYPVMNENPQLRWAFIRKVYTILSIQMLLTVAVASLVVFVHSIKHFFVATTPGLICYIILIFLPLIREIILEAAILTAVVVVSLTLYTFWAAKRGKDFSFLGPFLFCAVIILMVFGLIQIFFPLGRLGLMIYGALGALIFSGYIIYDTDNLIKRFTYDEYVWASVSLYLDIVNLFMSLLTILRAIDG
ncbi:Bax inhibitor [Thalictrum thalictroides]|uniref:Bax inhibitor n=1 Tax=Thalictrum thalictroides TaxID=46969 RepID=A0A7J6W5I7_THATH|nr:Bax inhibitor [Thalictrum thalictroides]